MTDLTWRGDFTKDEYDALHHEAFGDDGRRGPDRTEILRRHSLGWVTARDATGLAGFLNIVWDGSAHAWLQDVMVAERVRRHGVGRALVARARDGAAAAGCEWLHVDTDPDVIDFYLHGCNFRPTPAGLMRLEPGLAAPDAQEFDFEGLRILAPADQVSNVARERLAAHEYEIEEIRTAELMLDRRSPLVELGAGIGAVSCCVNRLLADPTAHIALEMNPRAFAVLERNRAMNGAAFRPVLGALGYADAADGTDAGPVDHDLWDPGRRYRAESVRTTLAELAADVPGRFNLLIDIEGSEADLLRNEADVIAERVETIVIELHPTLLGRDGAAEVFAQIAACGLTLVSLSQFTVYGFARQ